MEQQPNHDSYDEYEDRWLNEGGYVPTDDTDLPADTFDPDLPTHSNEIDKQ